MILSNPPFSALLSLWKRAKSLSLEGSISPKHPLFILWSNIKMFLDAREDDGYAVDIKLLSYFGEKVEAFSKDHILTTDLSLRAMLHEWLFYAARIADFTEFSKDDHKEKELYEVMGKDGFMRVIIDGVSWAKTNGPR